jgi:phthalate 4,5-dioxygenase oxygenase subunit
MTTRAEQSTRREQNELLTRTGPGTPMGELLRRYWIPALMSEELPEPDCPPVRAPLLGEKLIAFRDSEGRIALVDEFCPHRRVSLWFGRNEECGLRCAYHGWKFDVTGQCVDLPSEPEESGIRQRMRIKSYPCIEQGGVIWTYMGPAELQPPPPALEWSLMPAPQRFISKRFEACNFMQALEGGIDSSHVGFLHQGAFRRGEAVSQKVGAMIEGDSPVFEIEPYEGGLLIAARRKVADQYYWRVTPWIAPFHQLVPRRHDKSPIFGHSWVPIDDEHCWTWSYAYHPDRALTRAEFANYRNGGEIFEKTLPGTFIPLANKDNDYLMNRNAQIAGIDFSGIAGIAAQDASLQESMGPIVDRSLENLVTTDRAIIMTRRSLLAAIEANRAGAPLPGLTPEWQRVRSCGVTLPTDIPFEKGAKTLLFPDQQPRQAETAGAAE